MSKRGVNPKCCKKSPYMSKYWGFSAAFGGFSKVVPFAFFRPLESPYMSKSGVNPRFSKSPYMKTVIIKPGEVYVFGISYI